jgi:thiamine biosynthesis lipoprotein
MRTRVSITALHASSGAAQEAIGRAFDEMDRVVPLLNQHVGSSAVSTLNEQGGLGDAPPELTDVLHEARRLHSLSRGAFDVTVKPLVELMKATGRPATADVLELVDMSAMSLEGRRVRLAKSGMGLTLDGIAKGYVVDRMADVLVRSGMERWLIDAGGDIRASGRREDGSPWRVGVQDPDNGESFPAVTELHSGAVATSGSYENAHHIVDSATGLSPVLIQSATVRAPTTMMADALATTVFVMPPAEALTLIDSLPDCDCLLLDSEGLQLSSRRWRSISPSTH